MPDASQPVVVVGGGLAGGKTVEQLRAAGYDGPLVLFGAEPHLPYERPPLSKGVLKGEDDPASAYPHDEAWYAEQGVDLRLGTPATSLDTDARTVTLRDGTVLGYDKLLLATGSSARPLTVPGADLDGVLYLREMQESEALKEQLTKGAASSSSGPAGSGSRWPPPRPRRARR